MSLYIRGLMSNGIGGAVLFGVARGLDMGSYVKLAVGIQLAVFLLHGADPAVYNVLAEVCQGNLQQLTDACHLSRPSPEERKVLRSLGQRHPLCGGTCCEHQEDHCERLRWA